MENIAFVTTMNVTVTDAIRNSALVHFLTPCIAKILLKVHIKVLVLVKNYYIQWFIAIQDPTSNVELVLVQVAKMGKMLN